MSTCRRIQIDPYLSPCTKLKSKWFINPTTLNLIEEKVGSSPKCMGTGDYFLNTTPVAQIFINLTSDRLISKIDIKIPNNPIKMGYKSKQITGITDNSKKIRSSSHT